VGLSFIWFIKQMFNFSDPDNRRNRQEGDEKRSDERANNLH
jgi:hypothetical protein